MSEVRYIISDASKKIDVEPHVLRYWEEELDLDIPRNEMGHRYYTEQDIKRLKAVKALKDQGFQLKAIKMALPDINKIEELDPKSILELREELNRKAIELENLEGVLEMQDGTSITLPKKGDEKNTVLADTKPDNNVVMSKKMGQFKEIMSELIIDALRENNRDLSGAVSTAVSDNIVKEMDYLFRVNEEKEEERFKKFDATLREYQKGRLETAAAKEAKKEKKRGLFHKKNK